MPTRSKRMVAPRDAAACPAHTKSRHARDKALARFPEPARGRMRTLAAAHPALADLALTFPALLVALAMPMPVSTPSASRRSTAASRRAPAAAADVVAPPAAGGIS
jgi:hypothetical protein